jgi:ankyrin repeat protein
MKKVRVFQLRGSRLAVQPALFCIFGLVFLLLSNAEIFAKGKNDPVTESSATTTAPAPAANEGSESGAAVQRTESGSEENAAGDSTVNPPRAQPAPARQSSPVDRLAGLIQANNVDEAKTYFVNTLQPNDKDWNGRTALHFAALYKNSALADFFIRLGTEPDAADNEGNTPLNLSATFPDPETAKILVGAGANIHHKHGEDASPAQIAIKDGNTAFLRAVLNDKSVLSVDENGATILHLASDAGNTAAVQTIVQSVRGTVLLALAIKKDNAGKTALDLAFAHKESRPHADVSALVINAGGTSGDPFYSYFAPAVRNMNYDQRAPDGVSPLHYAIGKRYTGWTDYMLEKKANPNIKNTDGDTPLIESARIGDMETMRKLIIDYKAQVNVQDAHGNAAEHIAIPPEVHREALALLLENGANPNLREEHGDSPAHIVVTLNRPPEVLEVLLQNKADVSIHNVKGETPLYIAVDKSRTALIPLLLQHNSDIFAAINAGGTPFERALQVGGAVLDEIITDTTVRQSDNSGNTPLLVTVRLGVSADIVRRILDKNAQVNARNQEGDTALHIAVRQNNAASGELLISRIGTAGSDFFLQNAKGESPLYLTFFSRGGIREWMLVQPVLSATDSQGNTILHHATEWKLDQVIPGVVQRGANVEAKNVLGETPLFVAVHINSASTVRSLLAAGASLGTRDSLGNTALHAAVRWDAQAATEALITAKIDLNAYNLYGNTPLHDAVKLSRFALQTLLVQRGANLEVRDAEGNTPLMTAVINGNARSADQLVRSSADVNTRNNNGETPLLIAVQNERSDLVGLMLDKGAQIHARDADGESPFTIALRTSPRMVLSLLEKGREQTDDEGRSPLDIAIIAKKSGKEIEDITLWVGPRQLFTVDRQGKTPLRYAVDMGSWGTAKFLTDEGSNVFAVARDGKTPADIAFEVESGSRDAVRALFGGKSIAARDTGGNTALHYAARTGKLDLVQFLLELGADKSSRNTAGELPVEIARRWGHQNIADALGN